MTGIGLPFQAGDPCLSHFQRLEDLATSYWYAEVLFAALSLGLFDHIQNGSRSTAAIADAAGCRIAELERLLRALNDLDLIDRSDAGWLNSQLAARYLVSTAPDFIGSFLLYRRYIQPRWQGLIRRVSAAPVTESAGKADGASYEDRNLAYVQAMDQLARLKSVEIEAALTGQTWSPPILDAGGGAGALARRLAGTRTDAVAVLFDLPEVIAAARRLYPAAADWHRLSAVAGDFRTPPFEVQSFGLIVMSNFLHAYGPEQARGLLREAAGLLTSDGLLLVHDYFPDRRARFRHKGSLYDLNMMLNTYDGQCHDSSRVQGWLRSAGLEHTWVTDLASDTSVILAGSRLDPKSGAGGVSDWPHRALESGFRRAALIPCGQVATAPWVRAKCRFGCNRYGRNGQCPPHSRPDTETAALLKSYRIALLVEGEPPAPRFHRRLLALERQAFLAGFYKAMAFGAGPCPVCEPCPADGRCRFPEQARPSMEASGIDVYATARAAGFRIEPVSGRGQYAKYIGLLLLE